MFPDPDHAVLLLPGGGGRHPDVRQRVKIRLIATFVGKVGAGILLVGCVFNAVP